jgi:hypothetical protein
MPANPSIKYQVFISSTFEDLREERQAVTWSLLKLRHIPVGMENLSAGTDRGWETIQDLIDNTDYYVLLIAGRYGSIDPSTGKSWTQMEYEYARSQNVPVLAFIRRKTSIPLAKFEVTQAENLDAFISAITGSAGHLVEWWDTREDLVSAITTALSNHIREDERRARRRPGWWRGGTSDAFGSSSGGDLGPSGKSTMSHFAILLQQNGATLDIAGRFIDATALFQRGARIDRNQVETDLQRFVDDLPYQALLKLNDAGITKYERVCAAIAISYHPQASQDALAVLLDALLWAQGEPPTFAYRILSGIRRLLNRGIDLDEWSSYTPALMFFAGFEDSSVSQTAKAILQRVEPQGSPNR